MRAQSPFRPPLFLALLFALAACNGLPDNPYSSAAEQGNRNAQYMLGNRYESGQGGTKDYSEAVKWYTKAADQGNVYAQFKLAEMYTKGQGVTKNLVLAYSWYAVAAAQGDTDAAHERDGLTSKMTAAQLTEARNNARQWRHTGR